MAGLLPVTFCARFILKFKSYSRRARCVAKCIPLSVHYLQTVKSKEDDMNTSWFKSLYVLLSLFAFTSHAGAQVAKVEALYLFQFAKNIGWPAVDADKEFVIAVLDDVEVAAELKGIAANKKVGNRKVEVREVASLQNTKDVDILFVSSSRRGLLASAASSASRRKMLLVSGGSGECANGASISFVKSHDSKIGFEISERNIKKSGLSVTPKLLNLGKVVD